MIYKKNVNIHLSYEPHQTLFRIVSAFSNFHLKIKYHQHLATVTEIHATVFQIKIIILDVYFCLCFIMLGKQLTTFFFPFQKVSGYAIIDKKKELLLNKMTCYREEFQRLT